MAAKGLDAMLVTEPANVFYLAGFADFVDIAAAAIITATDSCLLVDPRYTVEAQAESKGVRVVEYFGKSTVAAISDLTNELAPSHMGYESDSVTVSMFRELRRRVNSSVSLRSTKGFVQMLRRTKDADEIALMQKAMEIADATFVSVVKDIRVGMTEKEVALLIDNTLRKLGADKEAFETIAASGPNSACPHATPTGAILKPGQFLKMDFGARYHHYNSDITRTVSIGKPSKKQKEVYKIVLDAQLMAIDAIAPGKPGKEIDAVARDYIASKGYGDNFGHGLGHALGITVHDGPALSRTSEVVLEPGMIVTVEPGIYIEGWGGVRIEDDVVVTETGMKVLTKATKELIIIEG